MSGEPYSLTLFGPPVLSNEFGTVTIKRRKSTALLAYMAMAEGPQTRERLANLFWPETDTSHALGSLRLALYEINKTADLLEIDRDHISFRHNRCHVDALDFREAAGILRGLNGEDIANLEESAVETLRDSSATYTNEFLRGFGLKDAPEFDDWLFFTAESLQTQLGAVLKALTELCSSIDATEAIGYAQRLLQLEELDEDHHRSLIELYVTEGRFSAAIRQFERCREVLAKELGAKPSSDLVELYDSLKGKEDRAQEATAVGSDYLRRGGEVIRHQLSVLTEPKNRRKALVAAVAVVLVLGGAGTGFGIWKSKKPPIIPTLMVLPFGYLPTGDIVESPRPKVAETAAIFVEGDLIKESGLQIRRAISTKEITNPVSYARKEDAQYILLGEVIDAGDELTLAVTLIEVSEGVALFNDNFIASEEDYSVYLQVIAQEVQSTVYDHLGQDMVDYLSSPEALLNPYCEVAYLMFPYHLQRDLSEGERSKIYVTIMDNLDDPYNCKGYFEQTDIYWNAAFLGVLPPSGAGRILQSAIERGGREVEGVYKQIALGIHALVYEGELAAAYQHFSAAYAEDPTDLASLRWWTVANALNGDLDQSLRIVDEMSILYQFDPGAQILFALISYLAGRYENAIAAADEIIARNNEIIGIPLRGMALIQLDRLDEAIATLEEGFDYEPVLQHTTAYLAYAYALKGNMLKARSLLAEQLNSDNDDPSGYRSIALPAIAHMGIDDTEAAFAALESAVEVNDPVVWLMRSDPVFTPVSERVALLIPTADAGVAERP